MVLASLINHPERLGRDTLYELRSIVARYPYFQTARLLMLNNMYLLHEPDFGAELRRSVLYIYDRRALCRLIEGRFDRVDADVPEAIEEPTVDRILSLIDAFLGTLPEEPEDTLQLDIPVVGDYVAQYLVGEASVNLTQDGELGSAMLVAPSTEKDDAEATDLSQITQALSEITNVPIESVADANADAEPLDDIDAIDDAELPESPDEGCFTETLAKIYIKQHKYSRALEIIRGLYLKYPEKNIYFADQIRFLEKLIINNNSK